MRHRKLSALLMVLMMAALLLAGCSASFGQAAEKSAADAAATVEEFYRWYLAYPGNPFAERAYGESPLLGAAFKAKLDAAMAGMVRRASIGHVLPGCAGAQNPQDAVEHLPR